ncbi:outer membrane efflux protein [Thioalkalivibrio nitratireducens DSM 14787]|uniref:Protein CyaE n=1 Tax=Thioalkalivibrio nitratireducens (strain DSM 14787 / UNIQEM 213 / ALEN2) TaxID=1255043 RepID=L0DX19_THIND|nr:outer membrane efflux protein [Thioalkalivibrio nitratireducens DSM 14787]
MGACGLVLVSWLMLALAAPSAGADRLPVLDLEQVVLRALENNPGVREAKWDLEAADARVRAQESAYWPSVSITTSGERTTLNQASPVEARPFLDFSVLDPSLGQVPVAEAERDLSGFTRYVGAVSVEYLLLDFGRRQHGLAAARSDRQALDSSLDSVQVDTVLTVAQHYFEILHLRALLDVQEESLTRLREAARMARRLERAGRVSAGDIARADADVARAEVEVTSLRNDLQGNMLRLRQAMGLEPGEFEFDIAGHSRMIDPADLAERLPDEDTLNQHPRLAGQAHAVAAQRERVRRLLADRYPSLQLTGNYSVQKFASGGTAPNYTVGMQLRWDVFDGGLRSARVSEARARVIAESERSQALRQQVVTDIRDAQQDLQEASERIELTRKALAAAELDLQLARSGYREGIRTFYDLSLAETAYREASARSVGAEFDRQQAIVRLYWAIGGLDDDGPAGSF